ncbi:MAG: sodium:calcium antiporter [Candidatus Aenigmatarchaeota archaeon]
MWLTFICFIASCGVLVASGMRLVKSLSIISEFLRITEFTAAFIIMAIATSLPELFVAVTSSLNNVPVLSLGNIIGANILNLTFVTGIIVLLGRGIKVRRKETKKDSFFAVGILALPLLMFLIEGHISRIGGLILIVLFFAYSWFLMKERKKYQKPLENNIKKWQIVTESILFVILIILLLFSANFVVRYAIQLSNEMNIDPIMLGFFILSIGTVLPELVFGCSATLKGRGEMALGDQIGTIITNSTLVLGIAAVICPITAHVTSFLIGSVFMLLSAFIFATFIASGKKFDITEGISLILLYLFFVFLEFYTKGII